jgi:hypothetical protein
LPANKHAADRHAADSVRQLAVTMTLLRQPQPSVLIQQRLADLQGWRCWQQTGMQQTGMQQTGMQQTASRSWQLLQGQ